ncbi:uncharacterized protein [Linepithema humile]|uniref:uncharacterized protein n=1 Tax=Linepithema humile TaxID=83485 RepID=UPI00351F7939
MKTHCDERSKLNSKYSKILKFIISILLFFKIIFIFFPFSVILNKLIHVYRNIVEPHNCLVQSIRTYLNDWLHVYCKNTSLHGFRYITMNGSKIIESFFWFMLCIAAIIFCVILMLRLWANYSNNPIVTTIYTSKPIWDLFFPAVTICNNNKVYRPHADIIAEYLHTNGFSRNESDRFFSSLIKLIRPDKISIGNVTAREVLDNLDMSVETLMLQVIYISCRASNYYFNLFMFL